MKIDYAEVMDVTKVSATFPQLGSPNIKRENMISTIADMLQEDSEVVVVEGPEGIGKTTLFAQFVQEYSNQSFGLFIRSSSHWAYNSAMLSQDLCDQIGWILKKESFRNNPDNIIDPDHLLRTRINDLQRQANKEKIIYYFVIDGLSDIPEEGNHEREMILKLLPFGIPRFRFIISGEINYWKKRLKNIKGIKSFPLSGFTNEETRTFFPDLIKDKKDLDLVHKLCKMMPGNFASIRRLLHAGTSIEQLLQDFPKHMPDLIEFEWKAVETDDLVLRHALAFIAFDKRRHSLASLSRLCKIEVSKLNDKLARCTFVEIQDDGEIVDFVCEAFKRHATHRLSSLRRSIFDIAIEDLLSSVDNYDALTNLPSLFNEAERYEELLKYLSPQHIGKLIDCGKSWIPLHQQADLGVDTALSLGRDGDLLRFGLQRATIASMESSEPWRSEIEAYLALDDFVTANALAQQMVTKEDRLHLLAVIARAKKTKSLPLDVELSDQIQQQYNLIDRASLGDKGIEIASDLLYTHPELAVELVQECMGKDGPEGRLDLALAQLSFNAFMEKKTGMSDIDSAQQTLRAKIKDPKAQKFMDTISLFFGEYSAAGVIVEMEKWENATDRIFALRSWTIANAKNTDAADVVEYALNTIIKTTTYTANAKVYNEIASPLVYIPDTKRVKLIIDRLDALKGTIQSAGPTVEYVKVQATMAEAEIRYNNQAALDRLMDLFFVIDALTEPGTKLAALAVLARVLKKIDPDKQFEPQGGIHLAVIDGLKCVVEEILTKTADHYRVVLPAISALAQSDFKTALEVVSKLNTRPRREAALIRLVESVADEPPSNINFAAINEAYGKIQSVVAQSEATYVVLRALSRHKEDMAPFLPNIIALRSLTMEIHDAELRCKSLCLLMETLLCHKKDVSSALLDALLVELEKTWTSMSYEWSKVDAGFKIVALLAKNLPEGSNTFLDKTEKARNEIVLDCSDTATTYIGCVRLAIRCFGGLLKRNLYNDSDLLALKDLIDKVPSVALRASAWSEVAMKFIMVHDLVKCQDIVVKWIRPIIESEDISDQAIRWQVIASISPILYKANNLCAKQLIDKLPRPYRDDAYEAICSFLITKQIPTESYDHVSPTSQKVSYDDFIYIYEVLQLLEADNVVYCQIESLIDSIHKKFNSSFSKPQIVDILQKLKELVNVKFPNPEFIKHDGYKILAEAQIARLERHNNGWDALALRARAIPNVADSAFVLMGIGASMPSRRNTKPIGLLHEASNLIPEISSLEDRIEHYERLAKLSSDIDKLLSKDCLRKAWNETIPLDVDNLPKTRQRIIDFAHRMNPEFAASLASESDEDPGRDLAREKTKQRIELLKLRERLASGEDDAMVLSREVEQQVEIAQMMLTGLNSNRVRCVHINNTRQLIKQASKMNVKDAYVVLSWVIENAVRRYSNTEQANTILCPLFEATRLSAELAFRIAARIRLVTNSGLIAARLEDVANDNLIRPGEREKALALIKKWAADATGFIKITDPYFGVEELDLVKLIRDVNPVIPVSILTSRKHQVSTITTQSWEEAYRSYWRIHVSDSDAGDVKIVIVGKGAAGAHPIHDRWLLTENGGLRVGTSANSLGGGKVSEMSAITADESGVRIAEVDGYLNGNIRGDNQDHISYQVYWL
ncbi:MAG: hypothetical protein PF904_12280 [Kiritimatiellae bacterium]|nr:hypothetical protein [Kiritimatiellia bacterium]